MSKTNNLTDFLTDLADTIRTKTGASGTINPQDFSQKITDLTIVTEVATSAAMDALLVEANVGQYYKFTGTTDTSYTNGDLYLVEE